MREGRLARGALRSGRLSASRTGCRCSRTEIGVLGHGTVIGVPVYDLVVMRTVILIVVLFGVTVSASAGTRQPSLRLVDDDPLTVQGARFGSSESVRLTVSRGGEIVARRRVRSGSAGGFRVRFAAVDLHRCDGGGSVVARGSSGRFAVAKVPQVECPMPLDPP